MSIASAAASRGEIAQSDIAGGKMSAYGHAKFAMSADTALAWLDVAGGRPWPGSMSPGDDFGPVECRSREICEATVRGDGGRLDPETDFGYIT